MNVLGFPDDLLSSAGTLYLPPPLCPSIALDHQTLVSITAEFSCPVCSTTKHPPFTSSSSTVRTV